MKVSQKLDYACRALLHLAEAHAGGAVLRADDIAAAEKIPVSFLAQILNELKRGDFVTSRRGKTGGWRLQREPSQISLLQVVETLEPAFFGLAEHPSGKFGAATAAVWTRTGEAIRKTLATATLDSIARTGEEPMYFI